MAALQQGGVSAALLPFLDVSSLNSAAPAQASAAFFFRLATGGFPHAAGRRAREAGQVDPRAGRPRLRWPEGLLRGMDIPLDRALPVRDMTPDG